MEMLGSCMPSSFTVNHLTEISGLPKPLNLRDFLKPGTHLAAIRGKHLRMTQTRMRNHDEIDPRPLFSLHEEH
jgi:hypothetical protein